MGGDIWVVIFSVISEWVAILRFYDFSNYDFQNLNLKWVTIFGWRFFHTSQNGWRFYEIATHLVGDFIIRFETIDVWSSYASIILMQKRS